jgi:hypothetical protein
LVYERVVCAFIKVVEDHCIGSIVQTTHEEKAANHSEKVGIVLFSDAIIKPSAMVVEAVDAPVALAAVLGVVKHMGFAHLAEELVVGVVEVDPTHSYTQTMPTLRHRLLAACKWSGLWDHS